jgi:hypothetical protein
MTKDQILKKSLDAMPDGAIFSGYDFAEQCRINGLNILLPAESTLKNTRANYLVKNCKRISRKSYIKKSKAIKKTIIQETIDFDLVNKERDIQFAITLLKANGYKIQKAITNYEEI